MQLRKDQVRALRTSGREGDFEQRAYDYLLREYPEKLQRAQGEPLRGFIRQGTDEAGRHHLSLETDVLRYLELRLQLGERWNEPEYAWIQDYLGERIAAHERLDAVCERLRFDERLPQ
jgi:hypothetical protein